MSYTAWLFVLGVVTIALHRTGRYRLLEHGAMTMMGVLAAGTLIAFLATPPSLPQLARMFVPAVPAGSTLLVASILGLMPTGINVAVWHSLWAVEHLPYWKELHDDRASMLRISRRDLAIGYGLSAVLGVIFLSLGAVRAPGRVDVPGVHGRGVLGDVLDRLYRDGRVPARVLEADAPALPGDRVPAPALRPVILAVMMVIFAFSLVTNTLLPNPVLVVTLVGVVSLVIAPVLYALNYYCVTRLIEDASLRPSGALRAWALAGIAFMTLAAGLYAWTRLGRMVLTA